MATFDNPAVIGILVGLPSAALGYLGYRRATKADENAHEQGAVDQIINAYDRLVSTYQVQVEAQAQAKLVDEQRFVEQDRRFTEQGTLLRECRDRLTEKGLL